MQLSKSQGNAGALIPLAPIISSTDDAKEGEPTESEAKEVGLSSSASICFKVHVV